MLGDDQRGGLPLPESRFEFDRNRNVTTKIGRTCVLLIVAVFFLVFTAIAFHPWPNVRWWRQALFKLAIEICWTFWTLAILYVWFDWKWLQSFYLRSERHFIRLLMIALAVGAAAMIWLVFMN